MAKGDKLLEIICCAVCEDAVICPAEAVILQRTHLNTVTNDYGVKGGVPSDNAKEICHPTEQFPFQSIKCCVFQLIVLV